MLIMAIDAMRTMEIALEKTKLIEISLSCSCSRCGGWNLCIAVSYRDPHIQPYFPRIRAVEECLNFYKRKWISKNLSAREWIRHFDEYHAHLLDFLTHRMICDYFFGWGLETTYSDSVLMSFVYYCYADVAGIMLGAMAWGLNFYVTRYWRTK